MSPPASADERLVARLRAVRADIAAAATRVGRSADDVTLVTVTKSAPATVFEPLAAEGAVDVGENRDRLAVERMTAPGAERFRWHFVGHVQSNKVRKLVPHVDVFHGVDSVELAERIERVAAELGRAPELLLQLNLSGEASKSGLAEAELPAALERVAGFCAARVSGLMTMAPRVPDPEQARPLFRRLGELARDAGLPQLSMGMTHDFVVAVEEGATLVRVGTRIVRDPEEPVP